VDEHRILVQTPFRWIELDVPRCPTASDLLNELGDSLGDAVNIGRLAEAGSVAPDVGRGRVEVGTEDLAFQLPSLGEERVAIDEPRDEFSQLALSIVEESHAHTLLSRSNDNRCRCTRI
jgi:hypothetical protein